MNVGFIDHHGGEEALYKENTALDYLRFPTIMTNNRAKEMIPETPEKEKKKKKNNILVIENKRKEVVQNVG